MTQSRTLLLVDDQHILYRSAIERVLNPPRPHLRNPVLRDDEFPWEIAIGWCSVYREPNSGKYQLWYQAFSGNLAPSRPLRCVVCYAESEDGIDWHKPRLKLFRYGDIQETNIVLIANGGYSDRYGAAVLVDPLDPDSSRRYKMSYFDFAREHGQERPGLAVAFSPDGIHWTKYPEAPLLPAAYGNLGAAVPFSGDAAEPWLVPLSISDATDAFFDRGRERFVLYHKMWIDGPDGAMFWKHGMGRTESRDFVHWSRPQLVLTPDEHDPAWVEFHHSPVFPYRDAYFGLLQILNRAERGGIMDIELAISRDGLAWQRPFRKPYFLARSPGGTFASGSLLTNGTPIVDGREIRFYYGGYSEGATGSDDHLLTTGIGMASLPLDRFVGLAPIDDCGQITLRQLDLTGVVRIALNVQAAHGAAWVELLDEQGYRVRGFSRAEAVPIQGDLLVAEARWKQCELAALAPGNYCIRIYLEKASLFALTLDEES